jgi:thioredoxin 1
MARVIESEEYNGNITNGAAGMKEPIHVTDDAFEKAVLQSKKPVVVDFWAPWCGPCLRVAPILDKLADEFGDQLTVAKVNTDENPKWAMQYGVQGIPTMIFVSDGKLVHRQVGALPEPILRELFGQFVEVTKAKEAEAVESK